MLQESILSIPSFHTAVNVPYILDSDNRAKIFHGTNFVNKGWPWYPEVLLDEKNIATMEEMGINTVRLGFMWTGAQPDGSAFNSTYFDVMGGIVDTLAKHNIYAFLDVHQDVMSSYYCLYDGFPKWVVDQSRASPHAFSWPLKPDADGNRCPSSRGWGSNYLSEACSVAFQTLYEDGTSFQDAFWAFWQKTAEYFKDKQILGYEIINEPWAGDIYADPTLLLPGQAGKKNLLPFYDRIAAGIREIDEKHVIFYEPVTWGMIFNGDILGSGFDHVPANQVTSSVFSFHYYCWWYQDTTNDLQRKTCDKLFAPKVFEQVIRETKEIGGAAMLTEWGQECNFNTDSPYDATGECNVIMHLADTHFVSWADWYLGEHLVYSHFDLSNNAKLIFSRIFATSIAGTPKKMEYKVENQQYELCYEMTAEEEVKTMTGRMTEIFVPFTIHFPNGVNVDVTPNVEIVSIDTQKNQVLLRNRKGMDGKVSLACVHISPITTTTTTATATA